MKKYCIPERELNKILKEMIQGYPKESNTFIAKKAILEIEKKHGKSLNEKPLYKESTLIRKVYLRIRGIRKEAGRVE